MHSIMWLLCLVCFVFWTYPIVAYYVVRRDVLRGFALASLGIILLMGVGISTQWSAVNWVIFSVVYFTIYLLLWWTQFFGGKVLKWVCRLPLYLLLGINYLMCTVGVFSMAIFFNFLPAQVVQVDRYTCVKEYRLGKGLSDIQGIRVEVLKTVPWLPFIQRKVYDKEYGLPVFDADYSPVRKEVYKLGLDTSNIP